MTTKNSTIAVQLTGISKEYHILHEKPSLVKKFFVPKREKFFALKNIDLNIYKGQHVGIIGPNGAGKTTLLKIISGITTATSGTARIQGKIVSLISQDSGFHPDLTGEQNILLNSMLLGMSRSETKKKIDDIINFAEIRQFIDAPFFTYSEGMKFRLGFSIAAHANADILIMDESMNVVDIEFEKRATATLKKLAKHGKTFIISSHNKKHILEYCTRVILLDHGQIVKEISPKNVNSYI